jgi:hypothetical protein
MLRVRNTLAGNLHTRVARNDGLPAHVTTGEAMVFLRVAFARPAIW